MNWEELLWPNGFPKRVEIVMRQISYNDVGGNLSDAIMFQDDPAHRYVEHETVPSFKLY